jgi:hypothetical protein
VSWTDRKGKSNELFEDIPVFTWKDEYHDRIVDGLAWIPIWYSTNKYQVGLYYLRDNLFGD